MSKIMKNQHFFAPPEHFFIQNHDKNPKIKKSFDESMELPMNPKRAKNELHRCSDGDSNPVRVALANFVDFTMVYLRTLSNP